MSPKVSGTSTTANRIAVSKAACPDCGLRIADCGVRPPEAHRRTRLLEIRNPKSAIRNS
jgi:hypothetical protein